MSDTNIDFAEDLIKSFGEDRFYHCCHRMSGRKQTVFLYHKLNKNIEVEKCLQFFNNIGLNADGNIHSIIVLCNNLNFTDIVDMREEMCKIAYGFSRFWKEYGLRRHVLPDHIHVRMLLAEKNEWVENYITWLKEME